MSSDEDDVHAEQRGHVMVWTLDRPSVRNALGRSTVQRLGALANKAENDSSIRSVVLTGAGQQAFCAGADLKERRTMSDRDVREMLALYRHGFDAIDRLSKPVVAAIQGTALGGGLELALCCDLRVAAAGVLLGLPEITLGIIPGAGGTQRLTRIVGHARAKELILTGRRIDAHQALAWGLVNEVVADANEVVARSFALAEELAMGAPIAVSAALNAIDMAGEVSLDAGLSYERACYERTIHTQDRLEALAAFHEKRKPRFQGR